VFSQGPNELVYLFSYLCCLIDRSSIKDGSQVLQGIFLLKKNRGAHIHFFLRGFPLQNKWPIIKALVQVQDIPAVVCLWCWSLYFIENLCRFVWIAFEI